jgi:glycerophosphoryl diester phosphodiesterase
MAAPIAIAHRGDPVAERENTLVAFLEAERAGADMVELDLRRTSDGRVVVLHDATLDRLWGRNQAVASLALREVVSIGSGRLRIPSFEEVLHTVRLGLMVDFTRTDVVEEALRVARAAEAMERCLFVTGNVEALDELRRRAPEARIGLTWNDDGDPPLGLLEQLGAEYWNPAFWLVNAERVGLVHDAGRSVSTWTVDEVPDMERMIGDGVDAVVSNQIRRLLGVLGRA